jgi:hypothetical protein
VTRHPALAWVLVAVWAAWLSAARGAFAPSAAAAAWWPDLGLVFLISLAIELPRRDLPLAAVAVAFARAAVSIDPPVAIFAAFGGIVVLARALRRALDLRGLAARFVLAAFCAFAAHAWFAVVHDVRSSAELARAAELAPAARGIAATLALAAPTALSTALAAVAVGPLLVRLPGPSALIGRHRWRAAVSSR